jgi:hypothetical protein
MTTTAELGRIANSMVRQEFGGTEIHAMHETAAAAVAKQAEAETNARYIMAMRNPRDIEDFRDRLLKECSRPYFVNTSLKSGTLLKYAVPRGKELDPATGKWEQKFIEGLSIRFVEVALRCFKNVMTQTTVVFESDHVRIVQVTVTDLENNIPFSQAIAIHKTVERKGFKQKGSNVWGPPMGRKVISERMNTDSEPTYLVEATEEETFAKQNSLISKTIRTLALRLLPGDIVEEALATAENMITAKDVKDPDAAKREIVDAFSTQLSIGAKDLTVLLGHPLDILSPAELKMLRGVFSAIKSGEASWHEILANAGTEVETQGKDSKSAMEEKLRQAQDSQKQKPSEHGGLNQANRTTIQRND